MIFFCEDCGTRNRLTDECIKQGMVTFRCKSCNYLNSYPLPGTTRNSNEINIAENSRDSEDKTIKNKL